MPSILVLNSGSSSLKFAVLTLAEGQALVRGQVENLGGGGSVRLLWPGGERFLVEDGHPAALEAVLALLRELALEKDLVAIGHRVVHGGELFTASTRIDDGSEAGIGSLCHLAPLHNPGNLAGIRGARAAFPRLPQVAVFDTAFHHSLPPRAYRYAVPDRLYQDHGVRRYGFHGTSHRSVSTTAIRMLDLDPDDHGLITAHLGNGCSVCAIRDGRSIDTSMGLTPLEGLVMGSRSGDVDPGLFAYLAERLGWDAAQSTRVLNQESGLLGLSGLSNDMRQLLEAEERGHAGASLAITVFCYRLAKAIAGLTPALTRLDALIFTGGIGEHAAAVRRRTLEQLGLLGLHCDPARNAVHGAHHHGRISPEGSRPVLVVATDEERQIAADTAAVLGLTPLQST